MTHDEIVKQLRSLESRKQVKIIYACESGSRAWGFPSPDSDYDIRFLYVKQIKDYLRVFPGKDVIDLPIEAESDMSGWDVRKALALLRKSNATLFEWLSSPIVYFDQQAAIQPVKDLMNDSFLSGTVCHHYISLAKKKLSEIKLYDEVKLKSYFYALRALLCAQFIEKNESAPPVCIDRLIEQYLPKNYQSEYNALLQRKMSCDESYRELRIKWLDRYLDDLLFALSERIPVNQKRKAVEKYDQAFQYCLEYIA